MFEKISPKAKMGVVNFTLQFNFYASYHYHLALSWMIWLFFCFCRLKRKAILFILNTFKIFTAGGKQALSIYRIIEANHIFTFKFDGATCNFVRSENSNLKSEIAKVKFSTKWTKWFYKENDELHTRAWNL